MFQLHEIIRVISSISIGSHVFLNHKILVASEIVKWSRILFHPWELNFLNINLIYINNLPYLASASSFLRFSSSFFSCSRFWNSFFWWSRSCLSLTSLWPLKSGFTSSFFVLFSLFTMIFSRLATLIFLTSFCLWKLTLKIQTNEYDINWMWPQLNQNLNFSRTTQNWWLPVQPPFLLFCGDCSTLCILHQYHSFCFLELNCT